MIRSAALALTISALASTTALAQAITLVPYQAGYELKLLKSKGKAVNDAQGRIGIIFGGSPCEGYTTTVRQEIQLSDGEGQTMRTRMQMSSFEASDGKSMQFNSTKAAPSGQSQITKGIAERANDGGLSIALMQPKANKIDSESTAVFPTEHVMQLITAARRSERLHSVRVYDGLDGGEKIYDTTAVIGPEVDNARRQITETEKSAGLEGVRRWPVAISYFEQGEGERVAAYVVSFDLFENGISGNLKLDFADFSLHGELRRLEVKKAADCPSKP
jgi:EipB-like